MATIRRGTFTWPGHLCKHFSFNAACGLGFCLQWAAGADAGWGGGMETKKQFGLEGVAAPALDVLGGAGGGPRLGPGSGGVLGFI